jgi:hypothetical protein
MKKMRFVSTMGLMSLASLGLAACAQDAEDIDRTQPNKIEKSAFEGTWHMRQTVVDANSTAYSTFAGLEGQMEKVNFEITEGALIAKRVHEDVIGISTSQQGIPNFEPEYGQPVGAWRIQSHFDIQRDYNAQTGERTNVINENGSDRPWYERDWMRVDWALSSIDTASDPFYAGVFRNLGEANSSLIVDVQDSGPEPTVTYERNAEGEVEYFDVVTTREGGYNWFECIMDFGFPNNGADCGPETVKVRTSFVKITEPSDYIARQYDEYDMLKFGFFRTERCVYDRYYGCRDSSKVLLANNWRIFEKYRNADGSVIPIENRIPKPLAYYVNDEFPWPLLDDTFEATEQWSAVFNRAVAAAQGKSPEQVGRMFYLCMNPGFSDRAAFQSTLDAWLASELDPRARELLTAAVDASAEGYQRGICKKPGVTKNLGDLRYSFINWVNNQTTLPWGGYGPSSADPLTAELVNGNANMNGSNYDEAANRVYELLQVMLGELKPEEVGVAKPTQAYLD